MNTPSPIACDVVIVGGGLAGLSAAHTLRNSGKSVILLEASDRLGGRTYGEHWEPAGRAIDLGGTWLLPHFSTSYALLSELGLSHYDSPASDRWITHLSDGVATRRWLSDSEQAELARVHEDITALLAASPESLTVPEVLAQVSMSPLIRDWHLATQRYLSGADLTELDAVHLLIDLEDLNNPEHYATQITGTTKSLVDALASGLTATVALNTAVTAIETTGDSSMLTTQHGTVYTASHVIVATSRNALQNIAFTPALTGPIAELAAHAHLGDSRKDWFVLDGAPEHFRVLASEGAFGYFRSEERLADGGMLAVGLAPRHEGALTEAELAAAIEPYLPGATVRAHYRYDWHDDQWAQGTWVAPRRGDFTRNAQLNAAGNHLQFVGGDVSADFPGTIEGALSTGATAATRLLER